MKSVIHITQRIQQDEAQGWKHVLTGNYIYMGDDR